MKPQRRRFLQLAAGVVALPVVSRVACAQTYPAQPVRMIVGYPPGNASDIITRMMAQSLSERLGQRFFVENRPGAGGSIGTEVVVRAPPDGYTLLMSVVTASAINATYYPNLNYNFIRDIAPIASIGAGTYSIVINPSVPAKTLPEFIAHAKANPGRINMASAGNGTPTHIFGELFKMMTGVDLVHIPYSGSFLPDLLGGQVQVVFVDGLGGRIFWRADPPPESWLVARQKFVVAGGEERHITRRRIVGIRKGPVWGPSDCGVQND